MLKNTSISASILTFLLASPAFASDLSLKDKPDADVASPGRSVNWTGIYFGGQVGYGNANHKLGTSEEDCYWESCSTYSSFLDGINSSGVFGGGTIGADIQRGHILFGVFGDYNISGLKTTIGATGSPDIDIIEEGDSWVLAARAGYLFGQEQRALLYVLGGYGQTDVTYTGLVEDGGKKDVTFSGFVAGAGGEYALAQNVFLGIEYQHFFGGKETLAEEDGFKATDDMDTDKVMAKLKIKLNGDLPSLGY